MDTALLAARDAFLRECCIPRENLPPPDSQTGGVVLSLNTRGEGNLIDYQPGGRKLYKHSFFGE